MKSTKNIIIERVETFRRNKDTLKKTYNEEMLRVEFVNPFFEALGWDVTNKDGNAEAYKDVIHEDAIKIGSATKAPDYAFRIGGVKKFFVEAKKPAVNIKNDIHPAFQLRRYAWSAKLPLSILTDFEEFAIYDCRIRPFKTDKASVGRVMFYTFEDYIEKWDEISGVFSKDAIYKGSFDKYVESSKKKRGTAEVDDAFLKEIETWRDVLARNIALRNADLTQRELNFAVARTIDRIIFLRIAEDRGMEDYGQLQALKKSEDVYKHLVSLYKRADDKYNSGLFHFRQEKNRIGSIDGLTTKLTIDDKVIKDIVKNLYYPDSSYEFSVLPADILGHIYEQFLGKVISLTAGHRAKIEEKPEVRKAGGVYYTPTYIVDYIVKNTVGELVKDKTPQQIAKLRILDPACGSGSFLIGAYQYLLDWHRDWYGTNEPEKYGKGKNPAVFKAGINDWRLTTAKRKEILLNNIYGVDIDPQAVEVSKLSLLLKVLEGESKETLNQQRKLFHERALPDLGNNIKCGNSLIGPDFYDNQQIDFLNEEERYRINVFDWEVEFPQIFAKGGFDAVIGNPPYVKARDYDEEKGFYRTYLNNNKNYVTLFKMWDLFIPFIEKGIKLLKSNGNFGMIVPDTIEKASYARLLREWLIEKYYLYQIDFFPDSKIFISQNKVVGIKNTIVFVSKTRKTKQVKRIFHKKQYQIIANTDKVKLDKNLFAQSQLLIDLNKIKTISLGNLCFTSYGLRLNSDKSDKQTFKKADLLSEYKSVINSRKYTEGKYLSRYKIDKSLWVEWCTERVPKRLVRPTFPELYETEKLLLGRQTKVAVFENERYVVDNTIIICIPYIKLKGINNRNLTRYFSGLGISRKELEESSRLANLKFILGILNSKMIKYYMKILKQRSLDMYPDDWKKIPIPNLNSSDRAHSEFVSKVDRMLELNKQLPKAKTAHDRTALQRQIDATDKQIDKLVYKLYDLTDEEIKIVEVS